MLSAEVVLVFSVRGFPLNQLFREGANNFLPKPIFLLRDLNYFRLDFFTALQVLLVLAAIAYGEPLL